MRKFIIFSILFLLTNLSHADHLKATGTIDVYFSPDGGATNAIISELNNARSEIRVQAYSFTSAPIAKALIDAKKRGIKIEVVLDKSQKTEKYSSADFVAHADIPVYIDSKHKIAHNKIMIIDRDTLITGSFNFTKSAEESNAENLLILKGNKPLVDRYYRNFNCTRCIRRSMMGDNLHDNRYMMRI
jgi:phosphatidylserine/phosphatidylglycerophosphate/cardiolipin synthase-like enzyme